MQLVTKTKPYVVLRLMTDEVNDEAVQVGVAVLVDGEQRAEVWHQVGPFDSPWQAMDEAIHEARDLYERQIPGQARLWEDGPLI